MSVLIKKELKNELDSLLDQKSKTNDAKTVLAATKAAIVSAAQQTVANANATESIDERLTILINGLQSVVTIIETTHIQIEDGVSDIEKKIEYLEHLAKKIDKIIDEEKKSNSTSKKQKVQN